MQQALLAHPMVIFIPYWSICNCCFVTFTEERTGKTKHLVRMLEFLEGVSVIRVGVTDDVAYKGGIFVAKFSNAVQVLELMKAIPTFLTIICISASMVAPESFIYSTIKNYHKFRIVCSWPFYKKSNSKTAGKIVLGLFVCIWK